MVAGGISPYHHLRTDDSPSKHIVGTPASGGIIGVVGLVVTKPKPPILQCYLHTACVKVFFLNAATHGLSRICIDIIYIKATKPPPHPP